MSDNLFDICMHSELYDNRITAHDAYGSESLGVSDSVGLTGYNKSWFFVTHGICSLPPPSEDHQKSLERTIRRPWSGHHMWKVLTAFHVGQWWLVRKEKIDEGIFGGRPSRHDGPKMTKDPRGPVVQWRGSRCVGVMFHQRVGLVKRLKRVKDPEEPVVRWRGCVSRKINEKTSKSLLFYGGAGFPMFRFLGFLHIHKCTGRGTKPVSGSPPGHSRRVEELPRRMLTRRPPEEQRRMLPQKRGRAAGGSPWYKAMRVGEARNPGPEHAKCRGKKPKFKDLVILNSSGQPQLLEALKYYKRFKEGAAVEVIANQEHHTGVRAWNDLHLKAKAIHWNLQGAHGVVPDGGCNVTAGVCIATRAYVRMGLPPGWKHDISNEESPGRLAAAWIEGIVKGGLALMSTYLWDSEGTSLRNRAVLEQAGVKIKTFRGPWILAGDFNTTPEQLQEGAGDWLRKVGGVIVMPQRATCRSATGGRTIDFCVMDYRMANAVEFIKVDDDFPSSPHWPIRIRFRAAAVKECVKVLRRPVSFETYRPTGCRRKPPDIDEGTLAVLEDLERANRSTKGHNTAAAAESAPTTPPGSGGFCQAECHVNLDDQLNAAFKGLTSEAEKQLCDLCDKVREDGSFDDKYLGRGEGLRVVQQVAVPAAGGVHGDTDLVTLGLLWIKRAFRDILVTIMAVGSGKPVTTQRTLQWKAIIRRLEHFNDSVQAVVDSAGGQIWKYRLDGVAKLNYFSLQSVAVLQDWAKLADIQARKRTEDKARIKARSWWQWVDEQMRTGAGALHSFSKRDEGVHSSPAPAPTTQGPTLGLQAILDSDRVVWKEVWEKFKGEATAPWRDSWHCSWEAELPTITGADLATAAGRFKKTTAMGCDSFRPQWFSWLSGELLDLYARLLMVIESFGCWPLIVRVLLIAQIPKPDGGRRPIGLLPTLVRIWEKLRKPIMASWRTTGVKSYNFDAKGRSGHCCVASGSPGRARCQQGRFFSHHPL